MDTPLTEHDVIIREYRDALESLASSANALTNLYCNYTPGEDEAGYGEELEPDSVIESMERSLNKAFDLLGHPDNWASQQLRKEYATTEMQLAAFYVADTWKAGGTSKDLSGKTRTLDDTLNELEGAVEKLRNWVQTENDIERQAWYAKYHNSAVARQLRQAAGTKED